MIVIVHGYDGSGPGHWQHWLADELRTQDAEFAFPQLPAPAAPCKDEWVSALADLTQRAREPVTFVCHSLGCWAVEHLLTTRGSSGVRAALLVAPPSPFLPFEPIESFLPPPRQRAVWAPLAEHTLVIGGDNDDYSSPEDLAQIAQALDVPCRILPGAGHINLEAGFGPWPFALDWLTSVGAL